jgi:hypothetical protein
MARFGITKNLPKDLKPEVVFEAAQKTFKDLGWEVYKMRPIAFLVEGRKTIEGEYILANIITKVFGNPEFSITLKADTATQEVVEEQGGILSATIIKAIKDASGIVVD